MALANRLNQINPNVPGLPCGIKKIIDSLQNQEDIEALENIMNMRSYPVGISNRQIHEVLLDEGYDVAFASVRLHRSKQCRCYVGKDSVKRRLVRESLTKTVEKSEPKRKVASKKSQSKRKSKAGK